MVVTIGKTFSIFIAVKTKEKKYFLRNLKKNISEKFFIFSNR